MKKLIVGFIALSFLTISCKDKIYEKKTYTGNKPVYTDHETFKNAVKFESSQAIENPGGIYFKDNYILLNEFEKGIHIIDNAFPSNPKQIGFIKIPGNTGMAIRGNHLYVNSLIDLVVIDVSDMNNPTEVGRSENAFPFVLPKPNPNYPVAQIDPEKGVVTGWTVELIEEKNELDYNPGQYYWCGVGMENFFRGESTTQSASSKINTNSTGISGSITKFAVLDNFLYIMEGRDLRPFDLSNPKEPMNDSEVHIWRNVETLWAFEDRLLMGTTSGMLIYNTVNKKEPFEEGMISHVVACDPVVAQGDYAYVTVRTGNTCMGSVNQLDIIDITNFASPELKESYEMTNPHGLGIDGDLLFICDGDDGLKVYDASTPTDAGNKLLHHFENIEAIDIIPFNGVAMLIGEDGIYQYDYSTPENMTLLSTINF